MCYINYTIYIICHVDTGAMFYYFISFEIPNGHAVQRGNGVLLRVI